MDRWIDEIEDGVFMTSPIVFNINTHTHTHRYRGRRRSGACTGGKIRWRRWSQWRTQIFYRERAEMDRGVHREKKDSWMETVRGVDRSKEWGGGYDRVVQSSTASGGRMVVHSYSGNGQ